MNDRNPLVTSPVPDAGWLARTRDPWADYQAGYAAGVAAQAPEVQAVTAERDRLRRGGEELGKSLFFWMELARKVTHSDDVIEDDGDGDWGVVAERLAALDSEAAPLDVDTLTDELENVLVAYDEKGELFGTSGASAYFLATHLARHYIASSGGVR